MEPKPVIRQVSVTNVASRAQIPSEGAVAQETPSQPEPVLKMIPSGPHGQIARSQGHLVKVRPGQGHHGNMNGAVDKYRLKYLKLKKYIKHMVFLNGALCDEVARADEAIAKVREQRRFLLRKLLQHQSVSDSLHQVVKPNSSNMPQTPPGGGSSQQSVPSSGTDVKPEGEKLKTKKKSATGTKKKLPKEGTGVHAPGEPAKIKPKKSGKGGGGKRLVLPIPLDNTGRPIFPIELPPLTIHSLGEITCDRPGYHSAIHIYPVGFCSTRPYASLCNPSQKCLYTCKILDSGSGPKFEISPEDAPGHVISCDTADECHANLLSLINSSKGVEIVSPEPRGAEFFGFCHPTVQNLIQSCPGARKCSLYKWVRFEVCRTDPGDGAAFCDDDPTINFDALQRSSHFQQGLERHKVLQQQVASALEPSSSLRSLLTSGPLIQSTGDKASGQGQQ